MSVGPMAVTDPAGAAAHVRQSLKPDGSWMSIEPMAFDKLEDNLNPVGRIYYASTIGCVPTSLSQKLGAALGVHAGRPSCARSSRLVAFAMSRAPLRRRST